MLLIRLLKQFGMRSFNRYYGLYTGFVVDNEDDEQKGKVRVKIPLISNYPLQVWAKPMYLGGGKSVIKVSPKKGDKVLCFFEDGDISFPYYLGISIDINNELTTDLLKAGIITEKGHKIILDDENDIITIQTKNGLKIILDDSGKIEIKNDNDKGVKIDGQKIDLIGNINIGEETATQPLVLGYKLLQWLSTHTHVSPAGNTTPPVESPNLQSVLSNKHKIDS